MKGQNLASQVLSRHTFRISRKKGSDFFDHRGTLKESFRVLGSFVVLFGDLLRSSEYLWAGTIIYILIS